MAKKNISYNEALKEIEEILYKIENEELDIDNLSENVLKATELLKSCKQKLTQTEKEIEKIIADIDSSDKSKK